MPGTEAIVEENINEAQMNVLRVPQLPSRAFLSRFLGQVLIFWIVSSPIATSSNNLESIRDYARSLLNSLPDKTSLSNEPRQSTMGNGSHVHAGKQNGTAKTTPHDRVDDVRWTDLEKEAEGGLAGCREAVEILTRNPKKGACCHNYYPECVMLNIYFQLRMTSTRMGSRLPC